MAMQQITIVGVGLIGGSFALALKKHGYSGRIVGCDSELVLDKALSMGVIDGAHTRPEEAMQGSQVVLLAAPVGAIIDLVERLGPLLGSDTLLTDVGSTKAQIVAKAGAVLGKRAAQNFLPGHPMAGRAHGGITQVDAELFQNAAWIFTPAAGAAALQEGLGSEFADLVRRIGARPVIMDAARHDRLCAWVSHLPQMIAIALANTVEEEFGDDALLHSVVGRQLREMTRTAASAFSMWRDVAATNKENLEAALQSLEQQLAHIRENLHGPELRNAFERANHFRANLDGKDN